MKFAEKSRSTLTLIWVKFIKVDMDLLNVDEHGIDFFQQM